MKLLLPTDIPLTPELPDGVSAVAYDPREPLPAEHHDAWGIVTWAISRPREHDAAASLSAVRYVQTLMAGSEGTEAAGFSPRAVICSGLGLHDGPVAEHALGLILAAARRLDVAVRAVDARRWARELTGSQPLDNATSFTLIEGSRVVIWGFGRIGQRLARYLEVLGATVTGVARSAGTRAGFEVVTPSDLPQVLSDADVLVNILPSTPDTAQAIDGAVLGFLPRKAWLVNVGRGATVDEAALIRALETGTIAGAALDVAAHEPLPADDPLWSAPHLILTPHSAGGRPQGADELIAANVRAVLSGEKPRNVVRPAS